MKISSSLILFLFLAHFIAAQAQDSPVTVIPKPYPQALKNPMKGFTTNGVGDHPWATLAQTYIQWNEIENHESDGVEKIIQVCNEKWKSVAAKNVKVIPRVYLHWDGDRKYWPADMQQDDYSSEQFRTRVLRLIEKLGYCWDNDPRIAFIEMGLIGKWGEHHSPAPSAEMQKILGDAFARAFKNKKVSVRHAWNEFTGHPFGEYWDSWAHYDQMWHHGRSIRELNVKTGRYRENYIGGEVAYDWGNGAVQPGASPTHSVALEKHRNFVINSIRWLHGTQLRWISNYDLTNPEAAAGAAEIQKAFGYRYELQEVKFSAGDSLHVAFDVLNTGSAPFYYNWPVEVVLLDPVTLKPVWQAPMKDTDIRSWLPGEGWTDPQWTRVDTWQSYLPHENWNPAKTPEWAVKPRVHHAEGHFKPDVPEGTCILALRIPDPAGGSAAIRFATANYLKGGYHPIGLYTAADGSCAPLPGNFQPDDPGKDLSLFYKTGFEPGYPAGSIQDQAPPQWFYISPGNYPAGTPLLVILTKDAEVYLVPEGTFPDTASIHLASLTSARAGAYRQTPVSTTGLAPGHYVLYAIDRSGRISQASHSIRLDAPVHAVADAPAEGIRVSYDQASQQIRVHGSREHSRIDVFNVPGQKIESRICSDTHAGIETHGWTPGIYLVHATQPDGTSVTRKICLR